MRYLRPKSLTWWAGCLALTTGTGALLLPDQGQLAALARLVALLSGSGDAAPMTLIISLGLGLIGLRDRIERGFAGQDK
ncbi:hypothetical protein [Phaeovulum vinaykumarii]|uniref:Uncharacterized protein n=1 Tax=Phaeovulum vinaykumarii TaxID=407234 RepID=A0A1N7N169_9RHOB|nr:hypothetical protein [Phaeovulum vinaykumarii]SIS92126.1 hypothetical protein SAMN05421795_11336 [Phaeovulum vinaykumarii]SOC17951.1 hypothetical protein SAMN05878426_11336 [Phaeovulum vinaykumarii]